MDTKIRIMNTAFELFARKGIRFTLTEVAEMVGIKKASIYAHFESKEVLLNEIIEKEISQYFFEINQENDDLKRIFFGFLNYYNHSSTKLYFWKRLLLLPPDSLDSSIIDSVHQLSLDRFQVVENLISEDIKKGKIAPGSERATCLRFFSLVHGLLSSELIYQPYNIKDYYEEIWNQFENSIKFVSNCNSEEED